MAEEKSFEEKMNELEQIVSQLEQGNVPLEESLEKFKLGIELSNSLQSTLTNAENTMAKMIDEDGNESAFEKVDQDGEIDE
ncbi:exodeoxyribonuclease VII small subunit [Lentilactobacillus laojiaonis]|uniref:exodeoxyribonuclease VII small subunit n=1 Tax=Lentilactobacillus laojiaonis TaxID=2883998 RepID=UPI001D0A3E94|nr:exodeoxyribonuclease VII small subunit [Lentilactobacillus laojiaonis]UDM32638.1 exodeoxyribonuclease VII small subunit [Lentilactobacillus laojiaonis]